MQLSLVYAGGLYDRTVALQNGSVSAEGINLNFVMMHAGEFQRRQARNAEFDASEFSLSTHTILLSQGDHRLIGIPVFPSRRFRHSDIYISTRSGIREPKDLIGKRVGAMEYQQTAGVWLRGILEDEYGVAAEQIEWYFGGYHEPKNYTERVPVSLPPNVRTVTISNQQSLDQMLDRGEIDALIGATPPPSFRKRSPNVARLFPDFKDVELAYFKRTGIFPIMHMVVLKRDIYEKNPWVAASLYKAFVRAKIQGMRHMEFQYGGGLFCSLPWLWSHLEETREQMGSDPFVYGLEENRAVLEAFLKYSYRQGMITKPLTVNELFAPETYRGVELGGPY
jgi:4,5-dihydroxyphthalate decarboxylase